MSDKGNIQNMSLTKKNRKKFTNPIKKMGEQKLTLLKKTDRCSVDTTTTKNHHHLSGNSKSR